MKREILCWRVLLPVLIAAIFVFVLAGNGVAAEHPKGDHPKADHPKAEQSKPEKPKSEHPTEHPK